MDIDLPIQLSEVDSKFSDIQVIQSSIIFLFLNLRTQLTENSTNRNVKPIVF